MNIERFESLLELIAQELPVEFYKELNGGILVLPDVKVSEYARNNDLYVMGQYNSSPSMGRYIEMFYGSFYKQYATEPTSVWISRMRDVLRHEFRHHLESLAGENGLEIEDEAMIKAYLRGGE